MGPGSRPARGLASLRQGFPPQGLIWGRVRGLRADWLLSGRAFPQGLIWGRARAMVRENMSVFQKHYKRAGIAPPELHFVLGSGFSGFIDKIREGGLSESWLQNWEERPCLTFQEAGLPAPSAASHKGEYCYFAHKKSRRAIAMQRGRLHGYEGHSPREAVQTVIQPFLSGTKTFVLTNMAGGLKKKLRPGSVIALKDHVNQTGESPLRGKIPRGADGSPLGARFPDMSAVYDKDMRESLSGELASLGLNVSEGVYVGLPGPELETPAQIEWLNRSGRGLFSAVGMSTVWEAIALKQAGAALSGFSLISNPAAGIDPRHKELSSRDMLSFAAPFAAKMIEAFFRYSERRLRETGRAGR